jgi:acetyl-CoA carboxylase biotin carboxyl carrier protein
VTELSLSVGIERGIAAALTGGGADRDPAGTFVEPAAASASSGAGGSAYDEAMSHTVVAELVAAVMTVEVAVGDRVTATDPVVVLESMKMEIPVLADVDGVVGEILVSVGDVVNDGDPLVEITPTERR